MMMLCLTDIVSIGTGGGELSEIDAPNPQTSTPERFCKDLRKPNPDTETPKHPKP